MKVLVACEESQAVTMELRSLGVEAYSCDIIECSGGHPEWHIQQDVVPLVNGNVSFTTCDGVEHRINGKWDMLIAFPPCTYLTVAANRWYNVERYGDMARQRIVEREQFSSLWSLPMQIATALRSKIQSALCPRNGGNLNRPYSRISSVILQEKQPAFGSKTYRHYSLLRSLSLRFTTTPQRTVAPKATAGGGVNVKKRTGLSIVLRHFPESLRRWLNSGSRMLYAPIGSMNCWEVCR